MDEKEVEQARRAEIQKQRELRRAALILAIDKHGDDEEIIKHKRVLEDAQHAEKKIQDELRLAQLDMRLAKANYEKALDKFIDPSYRLSDAEWEKLIARFKRG